MGNVCTQKEKERKKANVRDAKLSKCGIVVLVMVVLKQNVI